jgi:hypothetical protein
MRTKGKPNGNTKLGREFRSREREYSQDLGGEKELSLAQQQIINDSVWCDFMIAAMDFELQNKKRMTRKGKPHPLIDLRMRVAAHRRENYKLMGLKRVLPRGAARQLQSGVPLTLAAIAHGHTDDFVDKKSTKR